jgi:hypothetical protein
LNTVYHCCFLNFVDDIEKIKNNALYGKRFVVEGKINFWPRDKESKDSYEHFSVDLQDSTDIKNTWRLDVDVESLSREPRRFVKENCDAYFGHCQGRAFGVIGILEKENSYSISTLGMRIEHIEFLPYALD